MAAVQSLATLHVGNCSAPRHMAVAVGTPSLTIQGATSVGWLFPSPEHISANKWPKGCPCNENSCRMGTRECLLKLSPEDALGPAIKLIDARLGRPESL